MKFNSYLFFTILTLFFSTSCSDIYTQETETPSNGVGEKAYISLSIELETDEHGTRGIGDPGFGNGNQINNLLYALYTQDSTPDDNDDEGDLKPVLLWDEKQQKYSPLIRVPFNPSENNNKITISDIEIIKGVEYTLMLWAQYRPDIETDDDRVYFELRDDGIIRIKSYDGYQFPNNDDQRDVFCAVYKMVQYEDHRNLHLTLRRPFAQINIGADYNLLKHRNYIDNEDNLLIEQSAITISGDIANRYNLFKNQAEKQNHLSYTRAFGLETIPAKAEKNGYSNNSGYPMLKIVDRETHEETEYYWLSMCYILPDGKLGDVSSINIDEFTFTYLKNEKIETKTLKKNDGEAFLTGIPALRNRRTNIILQGKDFGPWYEVEHIKLTGDDLFNKVIGSFMIDFPDKYTDNDGKTNHLAESFYQTYKANILFDDNEYKCIMIDGEFNLNPHPNNSTVYILPVHRDFILYGTGDNTVIYKNANVLNNRLYHNIGQVRNLHIKDKSGKNHLFIDEEGYVTIYDDKDSPIKTEKRLEPLNGNNRSYNVYCDDGTVNPDPYFH